eukprot:COSAG01_NODE_3823_length_5658_cov_55.744019_2_plen_187_part_00
MGGVSGCRHLIELMGATRRGWGQAAGTSRRAGRLRARAVRPLQLRFELGVVQGMRTRRAALPEGGLSVVWLEKYQQSILMWGTPHSLLALSACETHLLADTRGESLVSSALVWGRLGGQAAARVRGSASINPRREGGVVAVAAALREQVRPYRLEPRVPGRGAVLLQVKTAIYRVAVGVQTAGIHW